MKIQTDGHMVNKSFGQAEIKIGRIRFVAGFYFRAFDLGIKLSRHSVDINLGFFMLWLDWYNYDKIKIDWLQELDEEDFIDG